MAYQDKKFKSVRAFSWPENGHRLNLYINAYLNVGVRVDKFKDYIAAGLEKVAAELREEAARDRAKHLLATSVTPEVIPPLTPEEEREVKRDEKAADTEAEKGTRMTRDEFISQIKVDDKVHFWRRCFNGHRRLSGFVIRIAEDRTFARVTVSARYAGELGVETYTRPLTELFP